jgi:hypothetical protein
VSTFVEKVRAELVAAGSVTVLVGTRVYPLAAPQGTGSPYVILTTVSDVPENAFQADEDPLRNARVQVDCYHPTYIDAHAVATAVAGVLGALSRPDLCALRLNKRDLYDDEQQLHRVSMDFAVWAGE